MVNIFLREVVRGLKRFEEICIQEFYFKNFRRYFSVFGIVKRIPRVGEFPKSSVCGQNIGIVFFKF
jgi:hypothetical protein